MRINTLIVIDIESNSVVERESFNYDGDISLASGGGGTTKVSSNDPEAQATTKLQREGVLEPLIKQFMPQWLSTLSTGRADQLPVAKSQTSAIKGGTSRAMDTIKAMLARYGMTGSPYAARLMADTQAGGEKQAASVGPNIAMDLFRQVPGMITGTGQTLVNAPGNRTSQSTGPGDGGFALAQSLARAGGTAALLYGMGAPNNQYYPAGVEDLTSGMGY